MKNKFQISTNIDHFISELQVSHFNYSTCYTLLNACETGLTSDNLYLNSVSVPNSVLNLEPRKKRFRRRVKSKYPCDLFKNHRGIVPKLEYIRCKLIRGMKRLCRHIRQGKTPQLTLHMVNLNNHISKRAFHDLQDLYEQFKDQIKQLIQTQSGPLTDGRAKRKKQNAHTPKSFNFKFCKNFYSHQEMVTFHHYYIQLIFAELDPDILISKLQIWCCQKPHDSFCYKKWKILKEYLQNNYIRQFGVQPHQDILPLAQEFLSEEQENEIQEVSTGPRLGFADSQTLRDIAKEDISGVCDDYLNNLTNCTKPDEFLVFY